MKKIKDSTGKEYWQFDSGTCYTIGTDYKVAEILEKLISEHRSTRVRLWYGENGKSWDEENDVTGRIGRSTGSIKIPILVNNSRSYGGGAILTDCIVKIVDIKTKKVLYQHPNFEQGKFEVISSDMKEYEANVNRDKETYARCRTLAGAQRLCDFMNGIRFNK